VREEEGSDRTGVGGADEAAEEEEDERLSMDWTWKKSR
jgi:hypothetical protein